MPELGLGNAVSLTLLQVRPSSNESAWQILPMLSVDRA